MLELLLVLEALLKSIVLVGADSEVVIGLKWRYSNILHSKYGEPYLF